MSGEKKKQKITWYQIVAVIIMLVISAAFFAFVYFTFHADQVVDFMDRSSLGDEYELLKAVRENFSDVAVYGIEQDDESVSIEFRYYDDVLENDTDLFSLSQRVRLFVQDYLQEHADDAINTSKKKLDLRFPDVHYSNYKLDGSADYVYSARLSFVTYEYSGVSAGNFINSIAKLESAVSVSFKGSQGMDFSDADFDMLGQLFGLSEIDIDESYLTQDQKEELAKICKENKITLK